MRRDPSPHQDTADPPAQAHLALCHNAAVHPLALGAIVVLGVLSAGALLVFLLAGHGAVPRGRTARLARIGRLWAAISASWLGANLRRAFASRERRVRIDEARRRADAERVAQTMGQMKGAFMKLGQMLSFVSEDIPAEMRSALAALQAEAPPMDFPLVRDVAERELGQPLERAFAAFDTTPLAAASIGQVHRARLASGEEVVVKIQYPGVAEAIRADLANVAVLYSLMGLAYPALDPRPVVDELRARTLEELDYAHEAENQRMFAELYAGHPFIRVPHVFPAHSTGRVLTMEYVKGKRFADVLALDDARRQRVGEILYRFVFGSIHRHGVFNGDPHPGNYLLDEEDRVVFLDYGCVKRFPAEMVTGWRSLVVAHLEGHRERFRAQLLHLGFIRPDTTLPTDLLYDYFEYFYRPIHADEEFTFSREYNAASLKLVFAPDGRFAGLTKKTNMPPDFVFVNRIQWGVYSILGQLEARANFHRIQRELFFDEPPSTELGRIDEAWRARRVGS